MKTDPVGSLYSVVEWEYANPVITSKRVLVRCSYRISIHAATHLQKKCFDALETFHSEALKMFAKS